MNDSSVDNFELAHFAILFYKYQRGTQGRGSLVLSDHYHSVAFRLVRPISGDSP